jgi:diguanylate cyclase (GGDEF)-like protein/PAS domain S-box-containing protein
MQVNGRRLLDLPARMHLSMTSRDPGPGAGSSMPAAAFDRLFTLISDLLVVTTRDGVIRFVNPAWEEKLGWSADELVGASVFELVHPDDVAPTGELAATGPDVVNFTNRYRHKDGGWRWLHWSARRDGDHWYAVAKDVTEQKRLERRALHDELTGLANRSLLLDHLRGAIARLRRSEAKLLAVLFVDLDGFKLVNDRHGHEVGDMVLSGVAERLRGVVREADVISRFGGDEFVIVAESLSHDDEALRLADRIVHVVSSEFELATGNYSLSCSVGVATTTDANSDPDVLLREADIAMYRAKTDGRGRVAVFDERARHEAGERVAIESELRRALAGDELRVLYQPVVDVMNGTLVGCEALVRWRHPEHGLLLPERFVPLAEATGLIVELGGRVLEEAFRQAGEWRRQGSEFTVSVNVSRRQLLEPWFPEAVRDALSAAAIPGEALCLEVTETAAPARHGPLVDALHAVRELGIKIALDDFGAGYSTLTNLRELPIDVIKIDRSFVAGIAAKGDDRGIVAAVMALARELGLGVIAEGVETEQQLSVLRSLGCRLAQGHLFSPAVAPEQLLSRGFSTWPRPGIGDASVIREFMRQIGIPARLER